MEGARLRLARPELKPKPTWAGLCAGFIWLLIVTMAMSEDEGKRDLLITP